MLKELGDIEPRKTAVLGVPISLVNMASAVGLIKMWVSAQAAAYVCVRDVHGVMRAQDDHQLKAIHEGAGMVTPDGMPLVWICRWRGYGQVGRVCGADLVSEVVRASIKSGFRHYFYGGKPGVAERMIGTLSSLHPGLIVAGYSTLPFRALTVEEDEIATHNIVVTHPHIVWVGLSTPKQEYWMSDHVGRIPGATLIGVGAAFDFFAGDIRRAPIWMRSRGFEWLHRLVSEPRRLWRRYLLMAPHFVYKAIVDEIKK